MSAPKYEDSTRANLADTGTVFDSAMQSSPDATFAHNVRGTESAKGLLRPNDTFEQGLGGGDQSMRQAVQNKYAGQSAQASRDFQDAQKHEAKAQHFEKLQHASALVGQEMQQNYQKALAKYEQDRRRKAARAGIVGNVLGIIVGTIAGIYTAGAGAAPGYAAGNMAGNAIAGVGD